MAAEAASSWRSEQEATRAARILWGGGGGKECGSGVAPCLVLRRAKRDDLFAPFQGQGGRLSNEEVGAMEAVWDTALQRLAQPSLVDTSSSSSPPSPSSLLSSSPSQHLGNRLVTVPRSTHRMLNEQPEAVAEAIWAWVHANQLL